MQTNVVTKEGIEEKIQAEVNGIVSAAVMKFNNRNGSNRQELLTPGRFFGGFRDLLRDNWSKFEPEGIPETFKSELSNMIAEGISLPSYSPFYSNNLYMDGPGVMIERLRVVVEEYKKPDFQEQPYSSQPVMKRNRLK